MPSPRQAIGRQGKSCSRKEIGRKLGPGVSCRRETGNQPSGGKPARRVPAGAGCLARVLDRQCLSFQKHVAGPKAVSWGVQRASGATKPAGGRPARHAGRACRLTCGCRVWFVGSINLQMVTSDIDAMPHRTCLSARGRSPPRWMLTWLSPAPLPCSDGGHAC